MKNKKYKRGDPHPNPFFNLTVFWDYSEDGKEIWTSSLGAESSKEQEMSKKRES